MPIKNSFSVLMCNFKLVAKIFLFILIVLVIVAAIVMSIMAPVLEGYFDQLQSEMPITPEEAIKHPVESMKVLLEYFSQFIKENSAFVSMRMLYLVLAIVISRIVIMLPVFPVTKILHEKMTSGFDVGLVNAFVSTLVQNLLFSLVFSIVVAVIDIFITVAVVLLATELFRAFGLITLPISLLIAMLVFSFRILVVSQWLPEYFNKQPKNVFLALGDGIKNAFRQFSKNYLCCFATLVIYFTLIVCTLLPTMGLVPILLVPTIMVTHSAMCLILNYTYHQHKYFTDNGVTVYNPIKKYDTADTIDHHEN